MTDLPSESSAEAKTTPQPTDSRTGLSPEAQHRLETRYRGHLQKFLTFVVLTVSGLIAAVQLALASSGQPYLSRTWNVLVLAVLAASLISLWGLSASTTEFYFIADIENKLGYLKDEEEAIAEASVFVRAAARFQLRARRYVIGVGKNRVGLLDVLIIFLLILLIAAVITAWIGNYIPRI